MQNDSRPPAQQVKAHRRPLWLFGFAIFISSNLFGTIFQIGALPIVVLAPLGAVSLLWNAVLSRVLLGEHFSTSTLAGTLLIALGATLIAVFGVVPEENHTLEELLTLFRRSGFVAYITLMCVSVAGVLLLVSSEIARSYTCAYSDSFRAISWSIAYSVDTLTARYTFWTTKQIRIKTASAPAILRQVPVLQYPLLNAIVTTSRLGHHFPK